MYLPWDGRETNKQELMLFGQMPSAKGRHRIYLKNMLLTERGEDLLPDWAVFTRCIVNAVSLQPTASREGFYVDEELNGARDA